MPKAIRKANRAAVAATNMPLLGDMPAYSSKPNAAVRRQRLELEGMVGQIEPNHSFVYVQTDEQLESAILAAELSDALVIDNETRTKRWVTGNVVSMQLYCTSNHKSYFIPLRMQQADRNFSDEQIIKSFRSALQDKDIAKIGHNLKYDLQFLFKLGIATENFHWDTMTAARLLNENEPHDLEYLCVKYCKAPRWKSKHDLPVELWPIEVAVYYGCSDVFWNYQLYKWQRKQLKREPNTRIAPLFVDIEMPNLRLATRMERRGIGFDSEYFSGVVIPEVKQHIEETRAAIFTIAGEEFDLNPNAPHQIAKVLFEKLGLPRIRENHVDNYALTQLKQQGYDIAGAILENRRWVTLEKMFIRPLPSFVIDGRIYTTFNTTGTETGRWTCNHPNLQQIPKKIGPLIRRAFIPSLGYCFVTFDYNQGELRMLAHFGEDEAMIAAFRSGMDFHAVTVCQVFDVDMADYEANKDRPDMSEKRTLSKNLNFGIPYGMSAFTLGIRIDKPTEEAETFRTAWLARFRGARRYINRMPVIANRQGYVETVLGRRRRLPDARHPDPKVARAADREAINSPIQGSVADLVKLSSVKHEETIEQKRWPYIPLLQLHDELLYEVPIEWIDRNRHTIKDLQTIMENVYPLNCPMAVNAETLTRWGDKRVEEYDEFEEDVKSYAAT